MNTPKSCGRHRAAAWCWLFALLLLCGRAGALAAVDRVEFGTAHGFFHAPFLLELESDSDGATIRFTTDSGDPTLTNGQTYQRPVIVNRTTVVRAAAFRGDEEPSEIITQTYLFLDDVVRQTGAGFPPDWGDLGTFGTEPGNHPPGPHLADYAMDPDIVDHPDYATTILDDMRAIPSLSVVLPRDDLFSAEIIARDEEGEPTETTGIYPFSKGFERAASVELLLPDGGDGFQINGSVEIQGATSTDRWKTAKLSMRLKFKAPYGPSELDYPLFGDDASDNVNTVILDSTNQQSWTHPVTSQQLRAQYVRDQFVGDLQNAMGGIAPHGRYAHLYLDGLYWGVYWMHEFVEEAFAVAYRGGKKSEFDIMRHRSDNAIAGNDDDYNAMVAAASGDLSSPAALATMESYLDLDQFIDYILVNFYAGNADWAFQNWNATRNRVDPESRWFFHNWDGEKTFQDTSDDNTENNDAGAPTFIHQQLLSNDEYRLRFADRVHKHCFNDGILTPDEAIDRYLWRTDMIERAIVGESARWGDNRNPDQPPYTRENWVTERDRLVDTYFPSRTDVLLVQLRADDLYPAVEAPDFNPHGGEVPAGATLTMSQGNPAGTIFYTIDGSDPRDPNAIAYTSAPTILGSVQIKARVLLNSEWSAVNEAVFQVPGAVSGLRVTEINYHPGDLTAAELLAGFDDNDAFEFIEIRNTGGVAVELGDVHFKEAIEFRFSAGTLSPGASIIVANDRLAFEQRYGAGVAEIAGEFSGSLANSGELVELRDKFDELIQAFNFDDAWYPPTDGEAPTLVIADDSAPLGDWDLATGWRPSTFAGGSPGAIDPTPIPLRITELHYHPGKVSEAEELAGFSDDNQFEFIEIRNTSAGNVELDGIQLSGGVTFTFPDTTLTAGAYALVVSDQAAFVGRYGNGFPIAGAFATGTLGDAGERVVLTGAGGERIHDFEYDDDWYPVSDGSGASIVIRDDSAAEHLWNKVSSWRASTRRNGSPGTADPAEPAALRITEIMYHPGPPSQTEMDDGYNQDDFDFIELANSGDAPINLATFAITGGLSFTFPNFDLAPGEHVLLVEDEDAFAERYGEGLPVLGSWSGSLSNSGERIALEQNGQTVLDFTYKDSWFPSTDGTGPSLTIIDEQVHPLLWDDRDSWRPSGASGGTPGETGDPCAAWLWEHFDEDELADPAIGGIDADPDRDGLSNLLEFALALDPESPQGESTVDLVEIDGNYFQSITVEHDKRALLLRAEVSADLLTWSDTLTDVEIYIASDLKAGIERLTFRDLTPIDANNARRFMRLKVDK
ncbi:MAG: hypothetical protein ACI9MB_000487 [Verrucomicrobiales bacterium]|jgi:hypothetical protein